MFFRRGNGLSPTIEEHDGVFTVRFTDFDGREHTQTFSTRPQARHFQRQLRKLPEGESFDRAELDRLKGEFTGSFTRSVGQEYGLLPPK
jgi:hypothetical protein